MNIYLSKTEFQKYNLPHDVDIYNIKPFEYQLPMHCIPDIRFITLICCYFTMYKYLPKAST